MKRFSVMENNNRIGSRET